MTHGITILAMRLAETSAELAADMERVGLTPERIRAGAKGTVNGALVSCGVQVPVVRTREIDRDAWLIESTSIDEAVRFGALLLRTLEDWTTRGFYYLKPSLVTGSGDPKLVEGQLLDAASLAAHQAATAGTPFRYELVGEAVDLAKEHAWIVQSTETSGDRTIHIVDWRRSVLPGVNEFLRVDASRVDPKFLNLLEDGLFFPALQHWRAQNPGGRPDLTKAYLAQADLTGADLRDAMLSDADLAGATLAGATLCEADLSDARLVAANLARADLQRVDARRATFARANLDAANFSDALADGASFEEARLQRANLSSISLLNAQMGGAVLANADLKGANLAGARLHKADLRGANLTGANLEGAILADADLTGATLTDGWLVGADLTRAALVGADLTRASLTQTNLFEARLGEANLTGANLMNAVAVGTDFAGANLTGCHVYGIAAWDVNLEGAIQSDLVITRVEPSIRVDDLEVAQFIYLLLNRRKLRNVLTTLGDKGVLVLGRFTERKALLEGIADRLRVLGYLPIIFDFERPTSLDVTETIKILAGLSLFVVADITNPRSVPLELQATVPDYMVPFVIVVQRGQPVFGMFDDLPNKYDWALPLLEYNTAESLLAAFDEKVVQPALEKVADVRRRKAQPPRRRSAEG
jgi:uncharacterized protein YjbI with pentapeptide repeats